MNKLTLLLAFCLMMAGAESAWAQNPVKHPQLSQKIDYLSSKYQELRNRKSEILREHGWESKQMKDNEASIEETFQLNYEASKKIVDEYGFPTYSMVGEQSSHRFWEMVQHFDHDVELQMKVVRLMKRAVDQNDASLMDFAYLSDRVLINMGREQNYGTQVKYDTRQKTYVPLKIPDEKVINANRKAVGLPPLSNYISEMNDKYDGSVVQKPRIKKYHDTVGRPKEVIERLRNR